MKLTRAHLAIAGILNDLPMWNAKNIGALRVNPDGSTEATNGHLLLHVAPMEDSEPLAQPLHLPPATTSRLLAKPTVEGPFTLEVRGEETCLTAPEGAVSLVVAPADLAWPNTRALLDAPMPEGSLAVKLSERLLRQLADLVKSTALGEPVGVVLTVPPNASLPVAEQATDQCAVRLSWEGYSDGHKVKVTGLLMPMRM